ncbi:hypothetical protein DET49_13825 [Salegentibacter sp. 24]|uniref:hypothetical protein n=1 Tax=Salegentibacter sp. 24 TaxID=2183986 RepID=UPI00105D826E|nr:hypothetical protein [Salegentibacter sp. 24]TDN79362.1 hypothetical protein DET49_13825 [Salegentibacter sp. 24]
MSSTPFSGPYSSYLTTISILNLQLMISTQFTDQECLDWEKSLRIDLEKANTAIVTDPITERLKDAPLFLLNELRLSSISTAIINFTSTTEHYIKDILELSLQRNDGLRKKAFSNCNISALELEEFESIDEIKKKLFKSISSENSKGQLFSNKFKKANSFLNIKSHNNGSNIFQNLDSIWRLRNKIAHSNTGFLKKLEINTNSGTKVLNKEPEKDEYLNFSIEFLKIIDEFTKFLKKWDNSVLVKWPANSFVN